MKSCGQCANFIRIKEWGGKRNGLCDKFDYNCHSDSTYATRCVSFKSKKYKRERRIKVYNDFTGW